MKLCLGTFGTFGTFSWFVVFVAGVLLSASLPLKGQEIDVWFGTGGNNAAQPTGIYRSALNTESGELSRGELAIELKGAGWIAWHPTLPLLYSTASVDGKPSICVLKLDRDKSLSILQTTRINDGSCFLTLDRTGSVLISTQYGGGTTIAIPVGDDGLLSDQIQELKHQGGSGVVDRRQNSPHPHYAAISPDNKFVFVPDLGMDKIVVYELDRKSGKLAATGRNIDCVKGGGPRHMKIRDRFAFVVNELAMSLSCFAVNDDGTMTMKATLPTLTESQRQGELFNSCSEVRVHPDGKAVYVANRGHDSISVFAFQADDFRFEKVQNVSVHGAWPRNFNLTSDGKWLLAAGAKTNSVAVFSVNSSSGKLTYHQSSAFVPGAICVSFR